LPGPARRVPREDVGRARDRAARMLRPGHGAARSVSGHDHVVQVPVDLGGLGPARSERARGTVRPADCAPWSIWPRSWFNCDTVLVLASGMRSASRSSRIFRDLADDGLALRARRALSRRWPRRWPSLPRPSAVLAESRPSASSFCSPVPSASSCTFSLNAFARTRGDVRARL